MGLGIGLPLLSAIVFLPLLGAALLFLLPGMKAGDRGRINARNLSLVVSLLTLALSVCLYSRFDVGERGYQFVERVPWVSSFGIAYYLGVDGISLSLVLLTSALMPLVVLLCGQISEKLRGYLFSMLVLETAMLGTLLALDSFLFYLFWELMLAPMYFIIGVWGGKRRIYATLKFVLYTVLGSLLMLAALMYVVWQHYAQQGELTFALPELIQFTRLTLREEIWLFAAFALAFGIKVPIFPFHTWLPDAHVEAPTGGSVILAGVLLKLGVYGFLRFAMPLFPRAAELYAPYLAVLGVVGIIYGALVAWAQTDIKKLIAYSSVSHLGFCVLGLASLDPLALGGCIFQLISHGISTGALFFMVGMLYERTHTRELADYGGLANRIPVFAAFLMVFTLSSIALPLTNGFVGEFTILAGSFRVTPWLTGIATLGVVLGAVYMLGLYLKSMFGEFDGQRHQSLRDLTRLEIGVLLPLALFVFILGIYPRPLLSRIEPAVQSFLSSVETRAAALHENEFGVAVDQELDEAAQMVKSDGWGEHNAA